MKDKLPLNHNKILKFIKQNINEKETFMFYVYTYKNDLNEKEETRFMYYL